jgi:chromosome segregation ATPase
MDTTGLKENFHNQLKEIDEKITQIQSELAKAQEYKLKLQGGLETLDLLQNQITEEQSIQNENLRDSFDPQKPDTSPIPEADMSPCEVSVYTPGKGETPVE